jgi:RHS repeat-associated protein
VACLPSPPRSVLRVDQLLPEAVGLHPRERKTRRPNTLAAAGKGQEPDCRKVVGVLDTRQEVAGTVDSDDLVDVATLQDFEVSGFGYDALNRRTSAGFGATTGNPTTFTSTIAYTWDAGNRLTQAVDSVSGTVTRQYDARFNTLTQEIAPEGQVDLTYDAAARRATFQVAGQTQLGYTFDAADRLTQIAQGATTVGFGYDNANRRTALTLPNGIVVEYGYDNANQLTGLTYKSGGTTLGALTYAYDNAGRRTQVAGTYARTNLPTALASATYNVNNQLTNWGGAALTYDNNGNLLTDGTNTHVWNARDQLASISGGVTASFGYDAFNRRRTKTIAGTKTDFLYDGLNFVQEKDGVTIKANLLTGLRIDEIFRRTQGAVTSDVLPDALGSSVALSDSTKAIITQYTYAPYGTTTQTGAANDNAQKFTGREDDGTTGLYYYRARYYSPKYSRFLAEDPIDLNGGPNAYAYVGGDPIGWWDPLGEAKDKYQTPKNPNKREAPPHRQPGGKRERNVGHPEGEEHSRVPKKPIRTPGGLRCPPIPELVCPLCDFVLPHPEDYEPGPDA